MDIAVTAPIVRCPYCVSGDEFRPMVALGDGRFACKCGHLSIPSDEKFKCACWNCFELRGLVPRRCG